MQFHKKLLQENAQEELNAQERDENLLSVEIINQAGNNYLDIYDQLLIKETKLNILKQSLLNNPQTNHDSIKIAFLNNYDVYDLDSFKMAWEI